MKQQYDLIAVGAGSAGLGVSIALKRLGFDVLLIDRSDRRIGGDCLNDGCVPSKALIHVSRLMHDARQTAPFGWRVEGETDFGAVMRYVYERQEHIRSHENAAWLREREGLDVALGTARFTGRNQLAITADDGSIKSVSAKTIVICTGSKPAKLDVAGVEQVRVLTNETLFSLSELPRRLLIVGAGPIAVEMGQAFARFGSQVTIVGQAERILANELPEVSALLQQRLSGEGIAFRLNSRVIRFADPHTAVIAHTDGTEETLVFDTVLVAIGRTANLTDLNVAAAGIECNENGQLVLNDYLQTTNPNVLAAGDAAAALPAGTRYFSHAAELHVSTIVGNLISPGGLFRKKLSYDHFSWVTFTDPEVATFGLLPDDLNRRGILYERIDYDFSHDDRAVIDSYDYARMILFTKPKGLNPFATQLLGGTIIAPGAGELAQELILAIQKGLTVGDFFNKIYPYPTASRVNKTIWLDYVLDNLPAVVKRVVKWAY